MIVVSIFLNYVNRSQPLPSELAVVLGEDQNPEEVESVVRGISERLKVQGGVSAESVVLCAIRNDLEKNGFTVANLKVVSLDTELFD